MIEKICELRQATINQFSNINLFAQQPTVKFVPRESICPVCGEVLKVYYTYTREVVTLHIGAFKLHSTLLRCDCNSRVYTPKKVNSLVPKNCKYGYDVMVYIGREFFTKHHNIDYIKQDLKEKNISISSSEISYLASKYIVYLSTAHQKIADKLKSQMHGNGGYMLHVDGTCDGDSPHLMSALDEISGFVLHNVKIPTENAADIAVMFNDIKQTYGRPIAIVTDMAQAFSNAVTDVFGTILHFICHFHFLRDIGKDLLSESYDCIRKKLKVSKITSRLRYRLRKIKKTNSLIDISNMQSTYIDMIEENDNENLVNSVCYLMILWCLDAKSAGSAYGFPFDRPHFEFCQRLTVLHSKLNTIKQILDNKQLNNKFADKVLNDLQPLVADKELKLYCTDISEKIEVFDQLREALHITLPSTKKGLNDNGQDVNIKTIERKVKEFRNQIVDTEKYENNKYQKMILQIDKYWDKLFADPIEVTKSNGEKIIIQPQRTNNLLEQFFRKVKRGYRKRTGNNKFNKILRSMIADTPLVTNLENKSYLEILLAGNKTLEECFAEIDTKIVTQKLKTIKQKEGKIYSRIKKAIRKTKLIKFFLDL